MATFSIALFGLPSAARSFALADRRVAAARGLAISSSDPWRRRQLRRISLVRIRSASNRVRLLCCSSKMGVPTTAERSEKNATEMDANPLLNVGCFPPFDKIEAKHVVPGIRQIIKELEDDLAKLEANVKPSQWESLVPPLERIFDLLTVSWGAVEHLKSVKDSNELRSAVEEIQPEKVAFFLKLGQSKPLYEAFKQLREGHLYETLNEAQKRIVEDQLKSAMLAGVALKDDKRARFNEIEQELEQLGTKFSNNVLDSTKKYEKLITDKSEIEGLPHTALGLAAQTAASKGHEGATPENGPWMITLAFPSYEPVMKHVKNRALREEVYRAYITRASEGELDNTPVINRILELRTEKAKLLGYNNFAEFSMVRKMATPETAQELIEKLRVCSWDGAVKDLEELKAFAREQNAPEAESIAQWDVTFWSERLRESKFDINEEELRPYFSLPKVMEGLFGLAKHLFSVEVEAADGEAPVWDKDVRFFRVKDLSGEPVAYFYFDPYARPAEKRSGAWMDIVVGRSSTLAPEGRNVRLPVAHMVCNQTPPVGDDPSLMTFREVETLFHEFGHALQHMLTKQNEGLVAGIQGIEWDAVELPSQFMENWCYHKKTLMSFAVHYKTGETLPVALYDKLSAARTFRAASLMLRQLHFASVDLELHTRFQVGGPETIYDVDRRVAQKTMVIPPLAEDRFLCSFLHIFTAGGYAAGYYSYKWAEVLSADAFGAFEDAGLEDENAVKETGQRFRNTILALGGGKAPLEVFKEFRGREPTTDALLRHSGLLPSVAA